eukprot:SAG11_NODE_28375_length_322_cov_0.928251_1_plen_76_part_01
MQLQLAAVLNSVVEVVQQFALARCCGVHDSTWPTQSPTQTSMMRMLMVVSLLLLLPAISAKKQPHLVFFLVDDYGF